MSLEPTIINAPHNVTVMLMDGGRSAGVANADLYLAEGFDGYWWLARLKLEEKYRGKGLGPIILKALFAVLEKRKDCLGLVVSPGGYGSDPEELANFYRKHGFVDDSRGVLIWRPPH